MYLGFEPESLDPSTCVHLLNVIFIGMQQSVCTVENKGEGLIFRLDVFKATSTHCSILTKAPTGTRGVHLLSLLLCHSKPLELVF